MPRTDRPQAGPELDHGQELLNVPGHHHTGLAEQALLQGRGPRQGAGMGAGRLAPGLGPPRLQDHQLLARRCRGPERLEELASVGEALDVAGDHFEAGAVGQVADKICCPQVDLVARGDHVAEAQAALGGRAG